jgi:two-component sensor histidine kinase
MASLVFRRGNSGEPAGPITGPSVGHLYLDVVHRLLYCLNDRARQLRREGIPFTPTDLAGQALRKPGGEPVTAADMPLMVAWREGRPEEATFVLERAGGMPQHIVWSTASVKDAAGHVIGVVGSVYSAAPEPDWQALAGLAHDLRTPLQSLKMLLAVVDGMSVDASVREVLSRVRSATDRALQIGMDLLEWCRAPVQKGRSRTEWLALEPLLRALVAEQEPAARQKGITLDTRLEAARGVDVHTDAVRLGRLLANLLANAVRYTPAGRVEFSAAWQQEGGERVLALGIVDSGAGISAEEHEDIFQPFSRGKAGREGDSSGSGVGLSVVDRLVEDLGLTLEVYSEYGRGSAFHLLLPVRILRGADSQR